jgi:hypothetical protein
VKEEKSNNNNNSIQNMYSLEYSDIPKCSSLHVTQVTVALITYDTILEQQSEPTIRLG